MPAANSNALVFVLQASGALSLAALFYLFQKHVAGHSLLAYQPRRRVPWGPFVALFAMGMPLLTVVVFLLKFLNEDPTPVAEVSLDSFFITGWLDSAFKVLFVLGTMAWLRAIFLADAHDLGIPTSWKQLANDIGIGSLACLAALLPINLVQYLLVTTFEPETMHPLVEQLQEQQSPAVLLLALVMAVLVAPLFEEYTFRGLFQGWLERHEDEVLAHASTERQPPLLSDELAFVGENSDLRPAPERVETARPARGWISELPHGWTPILLSGIVFGLAHVGHGVAPISLVLFGIVLGYLYQRTHRLVPSITAHMLFNAYSMLLLWLQLQATPPSG